MAWPIRSAKTIAGLAILFFAAKAQATSLKAYLNNSAGLRHYEKKLFFQSYKDFLKALEIEPLNPDLQMNLGLTLAQNEDWDKAEKAFLSAYELSKGDKAREFMALFNLGIVRGKKGEVDGALQAYQAALDLQPESLEVKTNIELLFQGQGKGKGQSGKQGGKDDNKQDQQKQNDKDQNNQNKNQDKQYEQPKQQPKQFQSKDLSKDEVRKILDEIQNQEQSIRAKEYDKGAKERKNDLDW